MYLCSYGCHCLECLSHHVLPSRSLLSLQAPALTTLLRSLDQVSSLELVTSLTSASIAVTTCNIVLEFIAQVFVAC